MKNLITLSVLLMQSLVFGQYTDMLNSNRPGGSQGAFSVGTGVLQFESGMSFGNEKHSLRILIRIFFIGTIPFVMGFGKKP